MYILCDKNVRKYFQGGYFDTSHTSIPKHVVIVTGCNTGIGKATVLELAKCGARVYMACRNEDACEQARQEIIEQSSNRNIFNMQLDLSSMVSIRSFVKKYIHFLLFHFLIF